MPNKSKLTDKLFKELISLAQEHYNHTEISKILKIKRQTIDYWVKKHNIKTISNSLIHPKHQVYIDTIKKTGSPKIASKVANLKSNGAYLIKKFKLKKYINKRGADKTLPLEEAQKRLPDQNDKVIGFKNGKYRVKTMDNFIYYKTSAKLCQGDPRGKSGSVLSLDYIKSKLKAHGYILIEDSYTIKRKALKTMHEKCGNVRENRFENFFKQGCPTCSHNGTSKTEQEVNEWIKSFGLYTEKFRFKGKTKGKEIDIYIPSLKLGIEYCGLYWHNENSPNPRSTKYHYDKMIQANEQGIRLLTVFEDEWKYRNFQVKSFLKSVFNIIEHRVYARKCELKDVEKKTARDFLETYHIQGKTTMDKAYGLYYNDELLGLITGNIHHRQKGDNAPYVLNRLVFKDGVQIVGGTSKLLKALVKYAQSKGYRELISWSDNRYSEGNVYIKCGFKLVQELTPDYSYVVGQTDTRQSKQSNKKKCLLKKGAIGTMENTERELALTLELYRIWDCGKKRWSIEI